MKPFTLFTLLFVSIMTLSLASCGATTNSESTGEYIDDTVITTKVKAAILGEKTLSVAEINVETFKGVVQLSGFVNSQQDISTAMRLTRDVGGVVSVKNDMRVK